MVEKNKKIIDFPVQKIRETPRDKLEKAIALMIAQYMRAVVYTRGYHRAEEITKELNLAEIIFNPAETNIKINYEIELNTTAIISGLAIYLDEI